MFTVLSVLLVVALLMFALLIAASASITSHSTADIELDAVSMYRQSDLDLDLDLNSDAISVPSRAVRAAQTNYVGQGVRHRTNKTSFCRNHARANKRK
jgi:uncharacterized membrane protein YjgN (DUF898 family)